jgi:glycyl-tRNA synthetase beta chain
MTDFLLELRCEEIPARMQDRAREDLARLFAAELAKAGLSTEHVITYATPRRLALIARGLPLETAAASEEHKGPRTSAPPQALEGFLRKTGLTQDQLEDRDGVWFAVVDKPGRAMVEVLAEAIPAIIRAFPWPKSMRWGSASSSTESLRWVRPLQGIVAILGETLVPCAVDGIASGFATKGHRFHHSGDITIGGAGDYGEKLRACHVIVDQDERRAIIREACVALTHVQGLQWIEDEALVAENAGLTEWPVPLLGDFDPAFLEVPPEVIRLTLATNQKYFVCSRSSPERGGGPAKLVEGQVRSAAMLEQQDHSPVPLHHPADGPPPRSGEDLSLAPAFICTANIEAKDGGAAIVAGNRKVLAARLSDARFFWEQDKKTPLAVHAEKLSRITFHEKLGTVADKVERVAKLARWLVEERIVTSPLPLAGGVGGGPINQPVSLSDSPTPNPSRKREGDLATLAELAARLCKADLVTEMVGEFPELQGIMGGYYARAEGLPDAVADAIRDHYKPVGQGDEVPTAPVTVAVSLADKLDTIFALFVAVGAPSGSKDPFALRRAALATISMVQAHVLRFSLKEFLEQAFWAWLTVISARMAFEDEEFSTYLDKQRTDGTDLLDIFSTLLSPKERLSEADYTEALLARLRMKKATRDLLSMIAVFLAKAAEAFEQILGFFADRLKVQQREGGVRHDLIDAVFALGGEDDLVRLLARVKALQAFVGTADGVNLLAGYKRAANILKKEGAAAPLPLAGGAGGGPVNQAPSLSDSPTPNPSRKREGDFEPAEAALIAALDVAEPASTAAVAEERFGDAMAALASLRAPIDAFFDSVTVNDADPDKRAARLALLARLTAAVNGIADFSKIEG